MRILSLHNDSIEYDNITLNNIIKFALPQYILNEWKVKVTDLSEIILDDCVDWIEKNINFIIAQQVLNFNVNSSQKASISNDTSNMKQVLSSYSNCASSMLQKQGSSGDVNQLNTSCNLKQGQNRNLSYDASSNKNTFVNNHESKIEASHFNPMNRVSEKETIEPKIENKSNSFSAPSTQPMVCIGLKQDDRVAENYYHSLILNSNTGTCEFYKMYFLPKYIKTLKISGSIIHVSREMIADLIVFSIFHTWYKNRMNIPTNESFTEENLCKRIYSVVEFLETKTLVVLIAGASGSGKSTVATKICNALSITRNISTDTIRAISRTFIDTNINPVLFHSTYSAGEHLKGEFKNEQDRILEGYQQQCNFIEAKVEELIETYLKKRRDATIIEGVHLSPDFMNSLANRKRDFVKDNFMYVPCVLVCDNIDSHKHRFARRGPIITINPDENKYIKYFENIQIIQNSIINSAKKYNIALVNNRKGEIVKTINQIHNLILENILRQSSCSINI